MDTSETYIKMCEKAGEIQVDWQPQCGDYIGGEWFIDTEDNIGLTPLGIVLAYDAKQELLNTGGNILWNRHTNYWLPRQDQLQAIMLYHYHTKPCSVSFLLQMFEQWRDDYGHNQLTSMEQLWLAFVMKEKYNMAWNGEDWILNENL